MTIQCVACIVSALFMMCLPDGAQPPKRGAPCQAGEPHPLAIIIDHSPPNYAGVGPWIHITFKNVSDHTLKIRKDNPEVLYLADIVDSAGRKVALTEVGRSFYSPPTPTSVFVSSGEITADVDLAPGQDLQSIWGVDAYYDMSKPGKYRVTVSRTFENQTICSNTIELHVE